MSTPAPPTESPLDSTAPPPSRWVYVTLGAILILAFALRMYALDRFSTWGDPAWTYTVCCADNLTAFMKLEEEMLRNHPPLDRFIRFLVMRVFGESIYVFTIPSVFFSVAGIACVFALARHLLDAPTALLAALLLAIHPEDIDYAQEGRNYAILNITVPLATLWLVKALEHRRTRDWLLYGVFLAACFYGHLLTAAVAVAHGLVFAIVLVRAAVRRAGWRRLLNMLGGYAFAGVVALVIFMPWLYGYVADNWPPGAQNASDGSINIMHPAARVWQTFALENPYKSWFTLLPAVGLLALLLRRDRRGLILPLIVVVTWVLAVEMTKRKFFHYRYVHCLVPMVLIVAAFGIRTIADAAFWPLRKLFAARFWNRIALPGVAGLGIAAAVVVTTVPDLRAAYADGFDWSGDYRAAALYLEEHIQPGDAVIVWYWHICIFSAYTDMTVYGVRGTGGESHVVDPADVIVNQWSGRNWGLIRYNAKKPQYDARLRDDLLLRGFKRIWLLWNQDEAGDFGAKPPLEALDQIAERRPVTNFPGNLALSIYDVPETLPMEPGPFFGWIESDNLDRLEGPYPKWDLPLVRWGLGPQTTLRFRGDGGPYELIADARRNDAGQALTIVLNGRELGAYPLDPEWSFTSIRVPLDTELGANELVIRYATMDTPSTPDRRAALFSRLQILPAAEEPQP